MRTTYIEPRSPWENPFPESFNSRARDERFNVEEFATLHEAQVIVEAWRVEYTPTGRTPRWETSPAPSTQPTGPVQPDQHSHNGWTSSRGPVTAGSASSASPLTQAGRGSPASAQPADRPRRRRPPLPVSDPRWCEPQRVVVRGVRGAGGLAVRGGAGRGGTNRSNVASATTSSPRISRQRDVGDSGSGSSRLLSLTTGAARASGW